MAHTINYLKNKILSPYSSVQQHDRPWVMDPASSVTDEAPRDPRAERHLHDFTEKDFQGHRAHTLYHGDSPTAQHHRPHHRSHRRHHRHHHRNSTSGNDGRPITPPSQRVQFILGEEDLEGSAIEPHPLFSEMETLTEVEGELEWKETARWVRFEEDVEEGGNRWSKPHVGTLSLHSLFELRSLLLNGTIMLDMEATTLDDIADIMLDNLINSGVITYDKREQFRDILLRKHKHLHEKTKRHKDDSSSSVARLPLIRSLAEIGRSYSSAKDSPRSSRRSPQLEQAPELRSLLSMPFLLVPGAAHAADTASSNPNIQISPSAVSLADNNGHANGGSSSEFAKRNLHFMRKLPVGSESSNILIGEVEFLDKPVAVFVRLSQASLLGDLTEVPVPTRFIYLLIGPVGGIARYHEIGRAMATLLSDEVFHIVAYKAKNRTHLLAATDEFLDAVTVLPPGEWDPSIRIEPPAVVPSQDQRKRPNKGDDDEDKEEHDEVEEEKYRIDSGLVRTGRLFGGLINDIKRKRVWYFSDFKDALALQSLASYIFLYFACLTPIVTFGGLLGDATNERMGAIESLLSGLISGVVYGLFSGQPLTILGSTGPVLVFEGILFRFCDNNNLDYLSFRLWVGLWIAVFLMMLVALDASAYVCYITRFTEENFATLIAFIFIFKALDKVNHIGHEVVDPPLPENCVCLPTSNTSDPQSINWTTVTTARKCILEMNGTMSGDSCMSTERVMMMAENHDRFLMSIILFLLTFLISVHLKNFKVSTFFPAKVRAFISDFSVIIAIGIMTGIDYAAGIDTPKLKVPGEFSPTWSGRGWLIPFFGSNPWWTSIAACIPAILGVILIFMDQQITAVIVNRKEHLLKKGGGYHLDLFVLSLLIAFNSILGLPWFVAATVLAINHVNSLKLESECAAPGEKPQFLGVRENRVTHIMIFITIGLSVLMTPVLRLIPMAVLFGVFLYMGVGALKGLQFFDRILIMLMPVKYQPDHSFLRKVPLKRVHLFTCVQLVCLIVLWVIKSIEATSILFPIMLVVMVGVRKMLERFFTFRELKILDDTMPEFSKKKSEDKESLTEDPQENNHLPLDESGNITIPLASGNVIRIPMDSINISEEVNKSGIWRGINDENGAPPQTHTDTTDHPNNNSSHHADTGHKKRRRKNHRGSGRTDHHRGGGPGDDLRLSVMREEDEDDTGITIQVSCPPASDESSSRDGEEQV